MKTFWRGVMIIIAILTVLMVIAVFLTVKFSIGGGNLTATKLIDLNTNTADLLVPKLHLIQLFYVVKPNTLVSQNSNQFAMRLESEYVATDITCIIDKSYEHSYFKALGKIAFPIRCFVENRKVDFNSLVVTNTRYVVTINTSGLESGESIWMLCAD